MCLVFEPVDDLSRARKMQVQIQAGGGLAAVDQSTLSVLSGETVQAAIFVLRGPVDCDDLTLDGACTAEGGCIARYGPVSQIIVAGAATRIDFTVDGVCQATRPEDPGEDLRERCGDGLDNDCDGVVDEDLMITCTVGEGACTAEGPRRRCVDGNYVCDATPAPAASDANCDGIDNDCDALIDEAGGCDSCLFDNDCLATPEISQCVDENCVECDPMDNAGCGPEAPVCNPATFTCGPCANDDQCPRGACVEGACRACDPARPRESCVETPESPICDAENVECRPCTVGTDCEPDFCFQGRCVECDPVGNAGCQEPTFICDGNRFECRTCERDIECETRDPTTPVCTDGACAECTVGNNDGCSDPTRPVCVVDPPGTPARCDACSQDDDCPTGQCSPDGRCVGCDPATQAGCEPLGGQPICDADAFCRPCVADLECRGDSVCSGGACRECVDADARGCGEDGAEPICDEGSCRPCEVDAECTLRPGERDLCVGGRCATCDPDTNRGCVDPTPVCGDDGCRACVDDAECPGRSQCVDRVCQTCDPADNGGCTPEAPVCAADGSRCQPCNADGQCPGADICVGGRCVGCDPMTDRPCIADGVAPICDSQTTTCVACPDDASCGGLQCLDDGRCAECDPDDGAGCGADPRRPICGVDGACRACAVNSDCTDAGLDAFCDVGTGRCVTCVAGTNAGCDPDSAAPVCEANQCRGCRADGECGDGLRCVNSRCQGCNPRDNAGCGGATPICQNGACVPCNNDGQCTRPPLLYCVQGVGNCGECAPGAAGDLLGAGCNANGQRPFCSAGGTCVPCRDVGGDQACADLDADRPYCLDDGRCAPCNPDAADSGCDVDSAAPICDAVGLLCRQCFNDDECGDLVCDRATGRCTVCAPDGNRGCDELSNAPICFAGNPNACDECTGDEQCAGNPSGEDCRGPGFCGCRNNGDCGLSPFGSHCLDSDRCGCTNNGHCPNGTSCRNNRCS